LRTKPLGPGSHVATSFVPGNDIAKALYLQLGFRETGELDGDEIVAVMPL
ncbi:MAG: GNAT family N-acetyltransferase, partial [Trueperaceae bacterium]|nr:GNAT family N-acetyltransferase [Trueperaceae bacterium]